MQVTGLLMLAAALTGGEPQAPPLTIARLHYDGGGDWYANPSSIPNLPNSARLLRGAGFTNATACP